MRRNATGVMVAGQDIDARLMVCPECSTLDLNTDVVTASLLYWKATCPLGHSWAFTPVPPPLTKRERQQRGRSNA